MPLYTSFALCLHWTCIYDNHVVLLVFSFIILANLRNRDSRQAYFVFYQVLTSKIDCKTFTSASRKKVSQIKSHADRLHLLKNLRFTLLNPKQVKISKLIVINFFHTRVINKVTVGQSFNALCARPVMVSQWETFLRYPQSVPKMTFYLFTSSLYSIIGIYAIMCTT